MRKRLKLMPGYTNCLMDRATQNFLDPTQLPLSRATRRDLAAWVNHNSSRVSWGDPCSIRPWTAAELTDFEDEGRRLWQQVRKELAKEYDVAYFSPTQQRLEEFPLPWEAPFHDASPTDFA